MLLVGEGGAASARRGIGSVWLGESDTNESEPPHTSCPPLPIIDDRPIVHPACRQHPGHAFNQGSIVVPRSSLVGQHTRWCVGPSCRQLQSSLDGKRHRQELAHLVAYLRAAE